MTAVLNHLVRIDQAPTPDAERRSNWARWVCTCGHKGRLTDPANAANGGRSHTNAMHPAPRPFDDAADWESLLDADSSYEAGRDD